MAYHWDDPQTIIGIIVFILVPILVIAALIWCVITLCKRRRARTLNKTVVPPPRTHHTHSTPPVAVEERTVIEDRYRNPGPYDNPSHGVHNVAIRDIS